MTNRITIKQALRRGFWTVNVPVLLIIFGQFSVTLMVVQAVERFGTLLPRPAVDYLMPALLIVALSSPLTGWIWWSVAVPKWKLWAYSRVEDVQALKIAAIQGQLIWPDGHIFEKTEWCSKAMRREILRLEDRS
jgi:hypothetical protein